MKLDTWGKRQLRTQKLVRLCTEYLLNKKIDGNHIYGLCMLTWITNSYDAKQGSYIRSTKLPALSKIFNQDFLNYPDQKKVGYKISELTGGEINEINKLINEGTGYTNFYKAFRKSSEKWVDDNIQVLKSLITKGFYMNDDEVAYDIAKTISSLPKIPKGNNAPGAMNPESLLSPLFFSLDYNLRFPLINGNKGVVKLLKQLKVHNEDLVLQLKTVMDLIGQGDIRNSIDIDRLGGDLPDFVELNGDKPKRKKLIPKDSKDLILKDEDDVKIIMNSLSRTAKRLHNQMTNLLYEELENYDLHEGNTHENRFDVLVKDIKNGIDVLIEVKTSSKVADVRMAIGQLLDYSRQLPNRKNTHLSVFIPEKPSKHIIDFIKYYSYNVMWLDGNEIYSNNEAFPFKYKNLK